MKLCASSGFYIIGEWNVELFYAFSFKLLKFIIKN